LQERVQAQYDGRGGLGHGSSGIIACMRHCSIRPVVNCFSTRNLSGRRCDRLNYSNEGGQNPLIMSVYRKSPFVYNPSLPRGQRPEPRLDRQVTPAGFSQQNETAPAVFDCQGLPLIARFPPSITIDNDPAALTAIARDCLGGYRHRLKVVMLFTNSLKALRAIATAQFNLFDDQVTVTAPELFFFSG